ncbi:MAG: hypothetical protein QMC62_09685 [Alteromonadaceae bacterium]|jgi:hypothetical protein
MPKTLRNYVVEISANVLVNGDGETESITFPSSTLYSQIEN